MKKVKKVAKPKIKKKGLRAIEWVNSTRFSVEVGQHAGQDLEAQVFFVA